MLIGSVSFVPVTKRPVLVVGLSGSSGAQYGIRLLRVLHELGSREIHLVISRGAEKTLRLEAGTEPSELYPLADHVHEPDEMAASISSGSFLTDGMVVCPCSMRTLAAIATGNADSLLIRAADVCLKERRRLGAGDTGRRRSTSSTCATWSPSPKPVPSYSHLFPPSTTNQRRSRIWSTRRSERCWTNSASSIRPSSAGMGASTRPVGANPNGDSSI